MLKRFIRLPKLGLTERELDLFLQQFRNFEDNPKAIASIVSFCNILVEDQRTHRGSKYQFKIIRTALLFLRLNFATSSIIHRSIDNLLDVVWTNIEITDLRARRAYVSGHLELLTSQMRTAIEAIYQNDMDALTEVLTKYPICNLRDHRGQTLLQWAASYGTSEMVELIYYQLPDSSKHDPMALMLAMLLRRMGICRTLLQHGEVVSQDDVAKIHQRDYKLSEEEKVEVRALLPAAKGESPILNGKAAQTPAMEKRQAHDKVESKENDSQVSKSISEGMMIYIFVAEMIPVLITAYNHSNIGTIRRIVVHHIRRLIRVLPKQYSLFISDLKCQGRYLCQWLCELISASFAHDDKSTCEESVIFFDELHYKSPGFYHDLSKQYNLVTSLECFRNLQLFDLLQFLGIFEIERNDPTWIISTLLNTCHLQFHGWSFFRLGQVLVIYNKVAICVLKSDGVDRISDALVWAFQIEAENATCSSPIRANKYNGLSYKLLCLVEFLQRNNPAREIGNNQEISGRRQPQKEVIPKDAVRSVDSLHLWRTKEEMISMEPFELDSFQSESDEYFLRVKVSNNDLVLFSESPYDAIYYGSECPNQIKSEEGTPAIKQVLINETNYQIKYESGHLIKSLPHLQLLDSPKEGVLRELKHELKLSDIAEELSFLMLHLKNEGCFLAHLENNFKKLKILLLNAFKIITPNEVISSDIVRALLQCLSISYSNTKSDENYNLSEMDLMRRREIFFSVFNHKIAFYKLIRCIKTAFEEIEHLPLYLFSYLQSRKPVPEGSLGVYDNDYGRVSAEACVSPQKGGIEGSIQFDILQLLSYFLYTQRFNNNNELHNPLFAWNIELKMIDSSVLIRLNFKHQLSMIQALKKLDPYLLAYWFENSDSIESSLHHLTSRKSTEIKRDMPYIKWLSSIGGTKSDWIDAVYRGHIRAYSFLPNCQGVYHSGVDIPLLRAPFSDPCIVCKNKASTGRQFPESDIETSLSNLQVGARYVIDLRVNIILHNYCLTTLRNVDRNEDIVNWCLQGSNDGKSWTTLRVHKNDSTLNSEVPMNFEIQPRLGFSLYRIMDLSPINHQGRLHVCGLDFYGEIQRLFLEPTKLDVLAYVPETIQLNMPSEVPTVAEFYMMNLMKSIRDNEFHVHPTGYSDSVYYIAAGWKPENSRGEIYYNHVPLVISPITKDYLRIAQKIQSQLPVWRLQFELVVEQQNGSVIASNPIFDLKWPIFPYLVGLVEQLVLKNVSYETLRDAKLLIKMKSASPPEKNQLKQKWMKNRGELLSDGDWNLVNQQNSFLSSLPGHSSKKCVSKQSAEDMLKLIRLLYQLLEWREIDCRSSFISQHLTRKIKRQLNDNISVMTGPAFPNWCFNLTQNMNFLFPFELRLELFRACALGPARSMKWLQDIQPNQDLEYANDHFYSYPPYSINPAFQEMDNLDLYSTFKKIKFQNREVVSGAIVTDYTKICRNLTEDDNIELFWKWAERVLEENADNMTNLAIKFKGEVGIGDGVTRDFYSTLCKALRSKCNNMWLSERSSETEEFVNTKFGLFPTPYPRNSIPLTILRRFYTMGLAVGKALQENHLLGLHFSRPFLKILCAYSKARYYIDTENPLSRIENLRSGALSYEDIWIFGDRKCSKVTSPHWLTGVLGFEDFKELYPYHASAFGKLLSLSKVHEAIREECGDKEMLETLLNKASLEHMGKTIENLGFSMEFMCISSESCKTVKLKDIYPWESNNACTVDKEALEYEPINNSNYVDYIRRTVEYCLNKGIQAQIDAFTRGFNQVFPLKWLSIFTSSELSSVICGELVDTPWEKKELATFIATSSPVTKSSPLFEYFVEVLASLDAEQRRSFLRWTTGYSALPPGGLKSLNPPLTIFSNPRGPYPKVQACFHALLLPEYSSAAELRRHLLIAISQETFDLL
nr:hypothetical transcript [Hymenolepis microstoma]